MWSIHVFLNKLLKADEENFEESGGHDFNFVENLTILCSNRDQHKTPVLSHFIDIPHINQQQTWDCGLACALMILRALGIYNCSIEELVELCRTTSIWTVDLAYLLQKFSISFTYCTVTLGANPDFSVETFYKDQLPNDLVRVNMLFQEAREAGIHIECCMPKFDGFESGAAFVQRMGWFVLSMLATPRLSNDYFKCRSVSVKELSSFILSGKYVAIALVDQCKLSHCQLEDVYVSDFYSGYPGYTGHYVIICGYDSVMDEFEIRDPASSRKHERVASRCIEQAHKAFGTDEDLLLISMDKDDARQQCSSPLGLFSL